MHSLCRLLRSKECELIIALTHMRAANDERLAREAHDIDIILGGHDHDYYGVTRIGTSSPLPRLVGQLRFSKSPVAKLQLTMQETL